MGKESVKLAFTIALSIIVVSGALTVSNSNYYVMALKKYHKTIADSQRPFSSYSNSSNNEFYKVIDGQRNRCHNDYGLNAVVCVKDTGTVSAREQPLAPQNTSKPEIRIPMANQSVTSENSTVRATTPSTQNESSLQAVGPAFTNNSPNADMSRIFSTPMTSDSLSSFLDSKKSSSEIPQASTSAKAQSQSPITPIAIPLPLPTITNTSTTLSTQATYATTTFYDNFESGLYTLKAGQISPNGKWKDIYTGYGAVGTVGCCNAKYMYLAPKISTSPAESHAALVITTKLFKDFDMTASVKTIKQLRQNSIPNNWETAWIMWNLIDNYHQYSFNLKKSGYELQKKDNSRQDDSAQIFLVTGKYPSSKIGVWQQWHIRVTGTATGTPHIIVWIDGVKIIDYIDNKATVPRNSITMKQGGYVGLYDEDAAVGFDNVIIKPL